MKKFNPLGLMGLAVFACICLGPVQAQVIDEEAYCWAVSDTGDRLVFIKKDGDGYFDRGFVGVTDIEAVAFNPDGGTLYGANGGRLGVFDINDTIDPDGDNFEFIPRPVFMGSVTLPDGSNIPLSDVDGLQFDLTRIDASTGTFVLWATERLTGGVADVLFQIDPNTGLVDTTPTPAFPNGASGLNLTGVGALDDVDDIAIDPTDGTVYVINNLSGADDQFAKVDPATGIITYISTFNKPGGAGNVIDMEGFSFSVTGELYGTTGASSAPADRNSLWLIDKENGETTLVSVFGGNSDYEGCACLTDNVISGNVYYDLDGDNSFEPANGEQGFSSATIRVYIDNNDDGQVDVGDTALCNNAGSGYGMPCPVTEADGSYRFAVAQGNYVLQVDTGTVPAGSTLTHPTNHETADFGPADFAQEDPNNNFGFSLPAGNGDLTVSKTSNGGAGVPQGGTLTYSITVSNNSGTKQTGINLYDTLPAEVTYNANSTSVTGPAEVYVLDRFDSAAYNNHHGSKLWASDWAEANDDGNAATGNILFESNQLRIDDNPDNAGDPTVSRTVDLSAYARPILSFSYEVGQIDAETFTVSAAASGNPLTTLETLVLTDPFSSGRRVYDLSAYISAATTISFQSVGSFQAANEFIRIDDVEIRDGETWRDEFSATLYSNNDGSQNFALNWIETGDDTDATAGDVMITSHMTRDVLMVQSNDNTIEREMDLSNYATARLSFLYFGDSLDDPLDEFVSVEVSPNGGGNWTELVRLRDNSSAYTALSYDISQYIGSNTRIRFKSSSAMSADDRVYFDDVQVDVRNLATITQDNIAGGANGDLSDGAPPHLISANDSYILVDGASFTVTFDVTLDNPIPLATTTITNSTLATSEESALPSTDDHTDNIVRGSIGDLVWNDANADGDQDPGELGYNGVTVELLDGVCTAGVDCPTTTTGANGNYSFTNLAPGTYQVQVDNTTLPVGVALSPSLSNPSGNRVVVDDETFTDADFGYYTPATVFGHLYLDTNGNGVQDGGEPDLPDVDVVVTDAFASPQTVSSNADGDWSAVVPPGSTSANVDENDPDFPADVLQSDGTDPTVVNATEGGNIDAGNDGYFLPGTIFGHLYLDVDGNGTQDAGEPDLVGVDILITDANGAGSTVTTDADGDWSVLVPPGSTTADVDETDPQYPTDAFQSEGNDPTISNAVAGASINGGTDGYTFMGTVSGHLYVDSNGNGTQDGGEPDLANVDVVITESDSDTQTVSTDADGNWSADVPAGSTDANVDESDPDFPADHVQSEGSDPSNVMAIAGSDVDAGIDGYAPLGTVSGHLYIDTNGNGTQDGGEPNLPNIDVVITESDSDTQTVSTDTDGNWSATVPAGDTTANVDETDPQFPVDHVQSEGTDPTMVTALLAANVDAGIDGYAPLGTVSGHLYMDTNGNGTQDVGEPNLPNIDVVITESDSDTQTVSTDANGDWSATVPAGNTTANVDETDPQFPADVTQTEGDDPTAVVAVIGSDVDAGNDGYYLPATISGHLYIDSNGNGTQDGGESDLANIDVVVTDSESNDQTVSTDGSGNWTATVPPGNTSANVDESDPDFPANHVQTEGTDPTNVNAVAGANTDAGIDGYAPLGTVSGHLYMDTNGNGTQDVGEPNLPNIDVVITESDSDTQTVSTDANGDWSATVPAGNTTADVNESDPDFPADVTQTEGDDPTAVNAVLGSDVDAGNDGYFLPATVSGHLYLDANGNGTQDKGEPNLVDVNVVVTDSESNDQTVTTDASGNWTATVPPGNTTANVDESDPDFPTDVTQTEGDDPTVVIAVAGDDTDAGNDGYFLPAGLGDLVWNDANSDGLTDKSESGIAGVTINLYEDDGDGSFDADDTLATSMQTGKGGNYGFASLTPGTYHVEVDASSPGLENMVLTTACNPCTATLAGGDSNMDLDFGFVLMSDPAIGLSKMVIDLMEEPEQPAVVIYELVVSNDGDVDLSDVQVMDDLSDTFPAPTTFMVLDVTSDSLTVNPSYDGVVDTNLLMGVDALAIAASGRIELTVEITPNGFYGPYFNSAVASGTSPEDDVVSDTSQDGNDADPEGDGSGNNSDPTVVTLTQFATVPTLNGLGLAVLVVLLMAASMVIMRRAQSQQARIPINRD